MLTLFHGSSERFDRFDLSRAGEATGVKFGFGIYLTESEASAVHYSVPRHREDTSDHYLYTVEIPDLTDDNHLTSALPVPASIVEKVEAALERKAHGKACSTGKDFRKWVGCTLTGANKSGSREEKAAAEFLNKQGVFCNVWRQAQSKPNGLKNIAVFSTEHIRIIRCEHIDIVTNKQGKHVLVEGSRKEVK